MRSDRNCVCYENNSFLLIMSQKICLACEEHKNEAVPLSSVLSEKHKGWECFETKWEGGISD